MCELIVKQFGLSDYQTVYQAMKQFTTNRTAETIDEIWLTQHKPVFTQGQAGKSEHILSSSNIPIIQSDRGGQITYHGPGQLVAYFLIDIQRHKINIRQIVSLIENTTIQVLKTFDIDSQADPKAPGVYVKGKKIASLGLRVRKGRTYHGVAINVDMDLSPFQQINPCGYQGLKMTQMVNEIIRPISGELMPNVEKSLIKSFKTKLQQSF